MNEIEKLFGNGIQLKWVDENLHATGPKGEKLYKRISPTTEQQQEINSDEFYIDKYESKYDLYLLKDRIIGDLVQPIPSHPLGGHSAILTEGTKWEWFENPDERPITILGDCTQSTKNDIDLIFSNYGHRSYGVRYKYDERSYCDCSGGPVPRNIPASEFEYSGEYIEKKFWRWRDSAVGNGGENYHLKVPLWYWTPVNQR